MKIYSEEKGGMPSSFVLILDKKEARTLMDIVKTAQQANKRRSSFRAWRKKLEERLCCF